MLKSFWQHPFVTTILHAKNYFLATMFVYAIGFISLPILTRILPTSDYGIISIWQGYTSVFFVIITLNTYTALGRYYYEEKNDFRSFCGTSLSLIIALLGIALSVILIFPHQIANATGLPISAIPFIIPIVMIQIGASWFEQIYIPQKKSRKIATRTAISALSTLSLSIALILFLKEEKYLGTIYAQITVGTIFLFYYFFQLKKFFSICLQWKHLKYILSYSIPLLPYSLGGIILAHFDRIMINKYIGPTEAGLYSFAYNIGMLLSVFVGALHRAWMPDYYKFMNEKNYAPLQKDIRKIFILISVAAIFLIFFGAEIGQILAPARYFSATPAIPIIVFGYFFHSIHSFYSWSFSFTKKNIYMSLVVITGGILNIMLNSIYIPKFGIIAGAYTTLVSFCLMALLSWFFSKILLKVYTVPISIIIKRILLMLPFLSLYFLFSSMNLNENLFIAIKSSLFVIFIITSLVVSTDLFKKRL